MVSRDEWNRLVNSKWPADIPKPTPQEAVTGAKRLWRKMMGRPFRGKVVATTGNRFTWVRRGVMYVNPDRRGAWRPAAGWPDIVHLLAHYVHARKHPNARPHDHRELDIEAEMTRYAIEHGFHLGKLKRRSAFSALKSAAAKVIIDQRTGKPVTRATVAERFTRG